MSSAPLILGVKQVFAPPLVDDSAGQRGSHRRYPSPDGAMALDFQGREVESGRMGWDARILMNEQDVTAQHKEFTRLQQEHRHGLMIDTYQPWSSDGRLIFLSTWLGRTYFYHIYAMRFKELPLSFAGVVALGSPTIPKYLVADSEGQHLLDLDCQVQNLDIPCSGRCYFRWMDLSPYFLAIGRDVFSKQPTLWLVDGAGGDIVNTVVLSPLKLNSKVYELGDIDQMHISFDRPSHTLYLKPLGPGAPCWALEFGEG